MVIITPTIQENENVSGAGEPRSATKLRPIVAGEAQVLRLNHVDYPCLSEEKAQSPLNYTMAELEAGGGQVLAAQERMIAKDL